MKMKVSFRWGIASLNHIQVHILSELEQMIKNKIEKRN